MKSFIKICLASTLLMIAACNKNLTVLPQNDITPDQIKTGADVINVLGGAYSLLQGPSAFGERFFVMPDLLASSQQVTWVGSFIEYKQFYQKALLVDNTRVEFIWENSYDIINTANVVIDKSGLVDESQRDQVIGEAKFIRGTTLFELTNLYGKPYSAGSTTSNLGVPIMTQAVYSLDTTQNFYVSRASVEDCYAQVIKDLSDAVLKLPAYNDTRANKYAAQAMLARVYMNMGNYAMAAAMADSVIESKAFLLTAQYNGTFNTDANSTEDIFGIQESPQSNSGTANSGLTTMYAPTYPDITSASSGRGDVQIVGSYFDYFEANDFRRNYIYTGVSIGGYSGTYPQKWMRFYKVIPVIRLAEMYLTRGEANLHNGSAIGAQPVDDINIVRERSNATPLTSVSVSDFVDERFRELGFEGDRLWTLKRLKMNVGSAAYDADNIVLPIPLREIQVNKNLVQNHGY